MLCFLFLAAISDLCRSPMLLGKRRKIDVTEGILILLFFLVITILYADYIIWNIISNMWLFLHFAGVLFLNYLCVQSQENLSDVQLISTDIYCRLLLEDSHKVQGHNNGPKYHLKYNRWYEKAHYMMTCGL